ncbi:uncharacterized protein LOC114939078 [Nylanderia fulva]|uniref:uncharacterized protein LOC114939078 n=1 Tax=Nylanderia fulva TaxID=613905 RepID=UPI0010FB927E|nr:uncharacterized protein LOC114939078 [Nylanderia fulva]
MISTKNESTWESVFDIGVNKTDPKFLEYLACPDDTDVIIHYLENKQYHSTRGDHKFLVNGFLHIITKHAKNPTILMYILRHFNAVKPKEINLIAVLVILINNVYSDNLSQQISRNVRGILNNNLVEVNNTKDLFNKHQIKESDTVINMYNLYDYTLRQIINRNGQIRRQKQYFEIFFV